MQPNSDVQLLREYAEHGSEAAFAEIIARHTNLVYSAALRQMDSPDAAADVAQSVFIGLAHGARSLSRRHSEKASLAGWLCRSARNISLNLRRDEFRRHSRERQAMEILDSISDTTPDWVSLRPVLDEAMSELSEPDYDALVMRFFQNQDLRSVGMALGVSDDTAQKRVARALDRLHEILSKRGVATSAARLSTVLLANAVQVAPAGLAIAISTAAALAETVTAATSTATATQAIAMTTLQKSLIAALIVAMSVPLYLQHQSIQNLRAENVRAREAAASGSPETTSPAAPIPTDAAELERLRREHGELLRLRGELSRLSQQLVEATVKRPASVILPAPATNAEEPLEPVQIFVANADATVPAGQTMAFGGWATSPGKRVLVFVQPKILEPSSPGRLGSVMLEGRFIEVPDEVLARVAVELNLDVLELLKVAGKASSTHGLLTPEQASLILQTFEKTTGVNLLTHPRIQTGDGIQATMSGTEQKMVAGQEHTLGPTLDVEPRIAANGSSVNLTVAVRYRQVTPVQ